MLEIKSNVSEMEKSRMGLSVNSAAKKKFNEFEDRAIETFWTEMQRERKNETNNL